MAEVLVEAEVAGVLGWVEPPMQAVPRWDDGGVPCTPSPPHCPAPHLPSLASRPETVWEQTKNPRFTENQLNVMRGTGLCHVWLCEHK